MKNIHLLNILFVLFTVGCNSNNESNTEKIQKQRDKIVSVSDKIIDIKTEILFGNSTIYILDEILIVNEISPKGEKGIHLFDKNTLKYITSTGIMGKGPGEISNPGRLGIDRKNRVFWAPDHGKRIMYKFPIDRVLNNEMFKPTIKKELKNELFIERFGFLNDSIALGKEVHVTSNSSFEMAMAKLNINTNVTEKFGYENPKAIGKKSNSFFALSVGKNYYVNCYLRCDLITICDLNGNLKYNIYGPGWFDNEQDKNDYFTYVVMLGNDFIASYIGDRAIIEKGNKKKEASHRNL